MLGFYDADIGLTDSEHAGMKIMALGDVDSDGYSDLITINDAQNSFQVHYYNPSKRKYLASFLYPVHPSNPDA